MPESGVHAPGRASRTRSWRAVVAAAVCAAALAAPGALRTATAQNSSPADSAAVRERGGSAHAVTAHVVIISVDGLRPDAIVKFGATTLLRLMREGSYSLQARTVLPSTTLPSHTSMLTGLLPEAHGVTWNDDETDEHGTVSVPTIFALAHAHGLQTAAIFSKSKFHELEVPGTLDYALAPSGRIVAWPAEWAVSGVEAYLKWARPNLLFVHIADPDFAGHATGWMGYLYGQAVRRADRAVGDVLIAADSAFGRGSYTVIVTADHGGHGRNHGSSDPQDVLIPWIAWGEGVRGGTTVGPAPRTMDTAATALWLLAVPIPTNWTGVPVTTAFARE
jgi:hypothetical protein